MYYQVTKSGELITTKISLVKIKMQKYVKTSSEFLIECYVKCFHKDDGGCHGDWAGSFEGGQ